MLVVPRRLAALAVLGSLVLLVTACSWRASGTRPTWEHDNPIEPLPALPAGFEGRWDRLSSPPTPERVRLGRWLFYDFRLSADGTVSCGTCHRPDQAFSQTEPVSTGVFGRRGTRKSQGFANQAWASTPHLFWDGRVASFEAQAILPLTTAHEMGLTADELVAIVDGIAGYRPYFREAFGDEDVTVDRIVQAIADYEKTRLSGNSPWDRWQHRGEQRAVDERVRRGHELFFGQAACQPCHMGPNFTDGGFHNIGVGWDAETGRFSDEGRFVVTGEDVDRGAFKTPSLRDVSKRAPYMHDGSVATLREVVELYNRGGVPNPHLSGKIFPLGLTDADIEALVAFMRALDSGLPPEAPPVSFPPS
ncbi:MAG: cytochrome-c peroxidase [Acidobacteria bacterium]|nr:cytochrome-c peroxidase [Acidobacteriota bacterium]